MKTYTYTTKTQFRDAFWDWHPMYQRQGRKQQNDYPTDIRVAFCDFVEFMRRDHRISDALAQRAIL